MIILGLDPAIRVSGYGVIELSDGNWRILDCGVIRNTPRMAHSECLRRIYGGVTQLIESFHPDYASLEEPFAGKNAATAIILGMARGAILTALANHRIPAYSYMPSKAKKAAVGTGSATKEQVALMMAAQFGIAPEHIPLDATDALALAICHAHLAGRPDLAALLTSPI